MHIRISWGRCRMRSEEEINSRINKISGFIELSKEVGPPNHNQINKLKKELSVLSWVLEEDNINTIIQTNVPHVEDSIIIFLREESEPIFTSEIIYHTGKSPGSISAALRSLVATDRINRFGKPRNYSYSIKKNDALQEKSE